MSLRSTFSLPEEDEEPVGVSAAAGRPLTHAGGGSGGEPSPGAWREGVIGRVPQACSSRFSARGRPRTSFGK